VFDGAKDASQIVMDLQLKKITGNHYLGPSQPLILARFIHSLEIFRFKILTANSFQSPVKLLVYK
jgi:hypothetical protein